MKKLNKNTKEITKSPSFKSFIPVSSSTSKIKSKNRSKGTQHEILLQKSLKSYKLNFEENSSDITGKPDIVFRKKKIVIFCDGDFWHGRNWRQLRIKLSKGSNADYWIAKIYSNIKRDLNYNNILQKQGWNVVRFWESDIKKDCELITNIILNLLKSHKNTIKKKRTYGK